MMQKLSRHRLLVLVIVALSVLEFAHYASFVLAPEPGTVLAGTHTEDGLRYAIMASVTKGFDNPWNPGELLFLNPLPTSPYIYVPLGFLSLATGASPVLVNALAKAVVMAALLSVSCIFFRRFLGEKADLAFALFVLPLGLGGLVYFTGLLRLPFGFAYEYNFIGSFSKLYFTVPLATGLLSLIFLDKRKPWHSAVLLGLTTLVYPMFGLAFFMAHVIYFLVHYQPTGIGTALAKTAMSSIPSFAGLVIFAAPWIAAFVLNGQAFAAYTAISKLSPAFMLSLLASFFVSAAIASFVIFSKAEGRQKKCIIAFAIVSAVFTASQAAALWFGSPAVLSAIYPAASLVFVVTLAAAFVSVVKSRLPPRTKFFVLWLLVIAGMSTIDPSAVPWAPERLAHTLKFPIAALASLAICHAWPRIRKRHAIGILLLVSVPSLLAYNALIQQDVRTSPGTFFAVADYNALLELSSLPEGKVLASKEVSAYVPYLALKPALIAPLEGVAMSNSIKEQGLARFLSSGTGQAEKKAFLESYNIAYVFFGERERKASGVETLDFLPFLEKIYDRGAKIYRVI